MGKFLIYNEVHPLRSKEFSNSAITKKLKISKNRMIGYGNIMADDFCEFALSLQNRIKKSDLN